MFENWDLKYGILHPNHSSYVYHTTFHTTEVLFVLKSKCLRIEIWNIGSYYPNYPSYVHPITWKRFYLCRLVNVWELRLKKGDYSSELFILWLFFHYSECRVLKSKCLRIEIWNMVSYIQTVHPMYIPPPLSPQRFYLCRRVNVWKLRFKIRGNTFKLFVSNHLSHCVC